MCETYNTAIRELTAAFNIAISAINNEIAYERACLRPGEVSVLASIWDTLMYRGVRIVAIPTEAGGTPLTTRYTVIDLRNILATIGAAFPGRSALDSTIAYMSARIAKLGNDFELFVEATRKIADLTAINAEMRAELAVMRAECNLLVSQCQLTIAEGFLTSQHPQ